MSEWQLNNQSDVKVDSSGYFVRTGEMGAGTAPWLGDTQLRLSYMLQDISQSHHFTVEMSKIKVVFPTAEFGNFLPVKNISYSEITFENMSIPIGIFGTFPITHKKQVGSITLTLYDTAGDNVQAQIRKWEEECFPKGKYVNFLSNIVSEFKYNSYTTTGKLNKSLVLYVIPANSVTTSRSYEENAAKLVNLSLTVVGFRGNIQEGMASSGGGIDMSRVGSPDYYPEGF